MSKRKIRTRLEIYMVILKTATEKMFSTSRLASYSGVNQKNCTEFLDHMESQGLITSYQEDNRRYWNTTSKGIRLAIDIGKVFEQAGIELREKGSVDDGALQA